MPAPATPRHSGEPNTVIGLRNNAPGDTGSDDNARVNILVVDDQDDKLLVLKTVLDELKQNLVAMRSGEEALRWLLENDCAVILLDVNMPGMDGFETAQIIRTRPRSSHIPIIFITGYADEMHTARGYSLGAVDYILSPIMPNILRSKVAVFVQLFKLTQQARKKADEHIALAREQSARAAAEAATGRASFLAEASKVLSSSLDVDSLMTGATKLLVPVLAEVSAIILVDNPGSSLVRTACAPEWNAEDLRKAIVADPVWVRAIDDVLATGQQKIIGKLSFGAENPQKGEAQPPSTGVPRTVEHVFMLPLMARGKTHGVVCLALVTPGREFDNAHIALAWDMAGRVAMALDNCLLFKKIQEADRRKNEFLATLSHELRNPLAPMRTALHTMRVSALWPAEAGTLPQMLERQIEHMSRLVDDLLDVARINQGKIELRKEKVDLAAKIMRVLETCRPPIEAAGLALCVSLPADSVWVQGDRVRLQQILENLLTNAGKYTKPGGRIEVSLASEQGEAVIRIRDTGIGIAPEMLPKIWEMFAQANDSSDHSKSGLGIGLSLARQLVHLHAGRIVAASEGLGKGSEFTVRLPLAADAAPETAVADAAGVERVQARHLTRRILVVDDNADAADSLGVLLGIWGHKVEIARNGISALQLARKFDPELVFLDIGLPEMNGYDVARRLREEAGATKAKLIALSGYGTERDRLRSRQAGFELHLVKPVDPKRLSAVIDAVFASPA